MGLEGEIVMDMDMVKMNRYINLSLQGLVHLMGRIQMISTATTTVEAAVVLVVLVVVVVAVVNA